jgi:FG-GAP-like repeat
MGRVVAGGALLVLVLFGCVPTAAAPATFTIRHLLQAEVVSVVTADVTGDRRPDLLATENVAKNGHVGSNLLLYRQLANGTLASPVTYDLGLYKSDGFIATGDFNGDGLTDVAVDESTAVNPEVRFLYQHDGTLVPGGQLAPGGCVLGRIVPLDLNHDGKLELIVTGCNDVEVWGRVSGTTWKEQQSLITRQYNDSGDFDVADLNGDGRVDLVGKGPYTFWISYQNTAGHFAAESNIGPACLGYPNRNGPWGFLNVVAGDVTGDGRADVVCTTLANSGSAVDVYRQTASTVSGTPTIYPADQTPWRAMIGDINRDGRNDVIVIYNFHSEVGIYRQQTNGTLSPEQLIAGLTNSPSASPATSLALADLDGNGKPDIVVGGDVGLTVLYQH